MDLPAILYASQSFALSVPWSDRFFWGACGLSWSLLGRSWAALGWLDWVQANAPTTALATRLAKQSICLSTTLSRRCLLRALWNVSSCLKSSNNNKLIIIENKKTGVCSDSQLGVCSDSQLGRLKDLETFPKFPESVRMHPNASRTRGSGQT